MAEERFIEGDYYEASYFGISIVYQRSSGYVNASKLCSDCNKHFYHWKTNKQSMVLFHEFSKCYNSSILPEFQVFGGDVQVRGTYVHPDLVAAVAMWIDPRFHLRVAQLLRSIHEMQLNIMVQQFEHDKQEMEFSHLMELNEVQQSTYPPSYFIVFKKHTLNEPYPYKFVKCLKSQRNTCVSRLMKEFPKATIMLDAMFAADGKELLHRIKTTLKDKLTFNHNNFKLLCNEQDAIRELTLLINQ